MLSGILVTHRLAALCLTFQRVLSLVGHTANSAYMDVIGALLEFDLHHIVVNLLNLDAFGVLCRLL